MPNEDTMQSLNEIFAEEVEAAIRYLHLAVTIKGIDRITLQETLLEGMNETMTHARVVAEKILEMGGVPSLDLHIQLAGEMSSGSEAIRTAVEFEQAALDAYEDLMESAAGDVPMEEFARAQVALESEHLSRFRLLLED